MSLVPLSLLLLVSLQAGAFESAPLFEAGQTWEHYLGRVDRQRELWLRTSADATVSPELVERVRRAGQDLQMTESCLRR